ncbi:hypothetical protein [Helicobacter bilis]|uniref:Uncharacterized protein n=1 Tax=Helicobacter bilis TaxID=37372 RepID=A0A4U8U4T6_9HELI|nr:hypothetical protein [Helicobacter bilis]MCI7410804.1 hypothetical protein [Helicobacter bilis]MDD7296243.1 hypothetical protein [Helicobacter bilis]MDY4399203.1 hypothetical protein [Helicobacter bilis]TLE07396.1 hypothetical protein LS78_009595 [Helicobacter bilis]TLE08652.1 hypothetical protein LS79_009620 [Helicobacter bilis]
MNTWVDKNNIEDTEEAEQIFRSPSAGAVINISCFDNDFIRFDMEGVEVAVHIVVHGVRYLILI